MTITDLVHQRQAAGHATPDQAAAHGLPDWAPRFLAAGARLHSGHPWRPKPQIVHQIAGWLAVPDATVRAALTQEAPHA